MPQAVPDMQELESFQLFVRKPVSKYMTLQESISDRYHELMTEIQQASGAPSEAVATSLFMRRFGFFITGQLRLLADGKIWDGPFEEIHLFPSQSGLAFEVDPRFVRQRRDGDLEAVLKQYAMPVIEEMRKAGHVSKLILWENIWGYVIWMYGMQESEQAAKDVEALLEDALWQPEMRKSFFRQFLGGETLQEATASYKRITCCLNKELPGTSKCPYCPLKEKTLR